MPAGRPTKYRKEYCDLIIRHFDIPATTTKKQTIVTRSVVKTIDVEVPNMVPTIESFARKLGVMTETIVAWTKEYPEFLTAYKKAKAMAKEILNENAIMGRYCEGYAKFFAINCTDMVDKSVKEHIGDRKITIEFVDPPAREDDRTDAKEA